MKTDFSLRIFILALLLDFVAARKRHVGPCIVVTEPEPCPDPEYIQVYLYTKKNPNDAQYVQFSETSDSLKSSNFDPRYPNKIIIHGFNTDMNLDVLQDIKNEYLKLTNFTNVWMVNYSKLVEGGWCYLTAVMNLNHVGKCLAQVVTALRRHQSNDIHVIGFSLGGQVPNFIANALGDKKLPRITGLDPAGPGFTLMGKTHRLDPSDANFVDAIHTNAGMQGDIQTCGHIDFYMNGGVTQPGCSNKHNFLNCNHRRAPIYMAESINTKVGFYGWKCNSYIGYLDGNCKPNKDTVLMGEHCPIGSSGLYIVHTAAEKPFALGRETGKYRVAAKFTIDQKPSHSPNDALQRIFLDIYSIRESKDYM